MAAFAFALTLFLLALALHVAWWRCRLPRHHTAALLAVFALPPLPAGALWFAGCRFGLGWPDLPGIALFYTAAAVCYLITYAGVEETSPTLVIIRTLEQAGERGCYRAELDPCITDERFITPRLAALRRDGLVTPTSDGARLTPAGLRLARLATLLARCFNLHEGA